MNNTLTVDGWNRQRPDRGIQAKRMIANAYRGEVAGCVSANDITRFKWHVRRIEYLDYGAFDCTFATHSRVVDHVCSIFYDRQDVCKLHHRDLIFNFAFSNLKGSEARTFLAIKLSPRSNPLDVELNPYWAARQDIMKLRDIHRANLFKGLYNEFRLLPVRDGQEINRQDPGSEICSKCRTPLYGDNYVLLGSTLNPRNMCGIAICPLCMHASPDYDIIEARYLRVMRVTFPRSIEDVIAAEPNEMKRDIYSEALKGISLHTGGSQYILIGSKYVGVFDENEFIYSGTYNTIEPPGRKIVSVYKGVFGIGH